MVVKMLTDQRAFYGVFIHVNLTFLNLLFSANTITYITGVSTKIVMRCDHRH